MNFYSEESQQVLKDVKSSSVNGLTAEEAARRLKENGKNKLKEAHKESLFKKFVKTLADPMIIMLIAAAVVQALVTVLETGGKPTLRDFADVIVILAVVIINTFMSLLQENKAEAAMDALMEMTAATSKVLRNGKMEVLKSEDVVVGDILLLEAGDAVPADCRVLESYSMKAEESALTGESMPVTKIVNALMGKDGTVPLGDRKNMIYSGSTIVYGRGKAVVVATGMDTEMGKIAEALSKAENEQTPLQKKLAELSLFLTKLVLIICAVVFAVGIIQGVFLSGQPFSWGMLGNTAINTFVAAIALAVAAIPEGLPAVVTIVLSIGVTSMSKRQALIRKLTAVETLGCTQIICSDKTGTLTQNKMTVVEHYTNDERLLAYAMALCSDATISEGEESSTGEPTEAALVNYAFKIGFPRYKLVEEQPRIGEAPFDSLRKMMSTVHQSANEIIQYTKGAPDVVVKLCSSYLDEGGKVVPMTEERRKEILNVVKSYSDRALRVLSAAYRKYDSKPSSFEPEDLEQDMTFIGLTGMIDPCRPEVYKAIEECRKAGIKPIMITGDSKDTAIAIGKELGIIESAEEAMEGAELDKYTDEELIELVRRYSVYARVQPEHKSRIVDAWQAQGMVTAMTGDGVNDAPSIKSADIGVGMGITGTDVTKGAADMVLADDNFATIVNAVEEGRKIYDNVMKVLQFQLSTNMSEVLIMFISSILNFKILTPVSLLWVNMVTDSLPGLALGTEKAEPDVMRRKPRSSSDGIFAGGAGIDMVWQGIYIALVELASYFIGYHLEFGSFAGVFKGTTCVNAMAMAFLTVNFSEMFCAINMRSRTGSIFSKNLLKNTNWWLVGASAVTIVLTLIAIYMPGLQEVFNVMPGTFQTRELLISIGLALTIFPVFEIGKAMHRAVRKK